MKKYLFAAWLSFRTHTIYRAEIVLGVLSTLFTLAVQVFLWKSLYANSPGSMEVSGDAMVTYFIIGSAITLFLRSADTGWQVSQDMKKGTIATSLCRPMAYPLQMLAGAAGGCLFSLLFAAVPLAAAGALLFHIQGPASPVAAGLAVVVVLAALLVYFLLWLITGMISFWVGEMPWALPSLINAFIWFFSGSAIPLWIYPSWLRRVAEVLPGRFAYDLPLSLYIGRITPAEGLAGLGMEMAWIGCLALGAYGIWRAGTRKLAIQGG
jgi:ABC-2 type transport system permease protein